MVVPSSGYLLTEKGSSGGVAFYCQADSMLRDSRRVQGPPG